MDCIFLKKTPSVLHGFMLDWRKHLAVHCQLCPRLGIQLWLVVSTMFILYFWFKWLSASGKDASFQAVESTINNHGWRLPCLLAHSVYWYSQLIFLDKPPTRALPLHDFRWQPRVSAAGSPAIDHRAAWAMNVGRHGTSRETSPCYGQPTSFYGAVLVLFYGLNIGWPRNMA